jgi:ribosomal protein L37E
MQTYQIAEDGQSILCLLCGMRSWSLKDVANRYCGSCHQYHSVLERQHEWEQAQQKKRNSIMGRIRAALKLPF